ncbi:metal ABC transporter solute-binding protein, Zn/Mn family [Saccharomonospora cyanea]|uniref:ABC-type metal ion transport system, periplasmic component/surface adhesin n=1 Tax=Saccharomonospora cyanea NA-134 TaxID=882082 RepID=H5XFI3_9PSEU|nr:zinc ABC transporter substrate-binding protein [Saccharomonospora cyanea]EHR59351.1 ABC-type metal ion transport system, periplasmic component/surface adhesin [Saccharomonospora cyanea NA-134]
MGLDEALSSRRRRARRRDVRTVVAVVVAATLTVSLAVGYSLGPGSSASEGRAAGTPLRVVTTTTFLDDTVRRIGGEDVTTVRLMGPGVDPHLYQAKASDLREMRRADAVVAVGLYLEGSLMRTLQAVAETKPVLFAAEAVPEHLLLSPPPGAAPEEEHDPHVWFEPRLWVYVVDAVAAELSELDPAHAADYHRRAATYREQVLALDEEVRAMLSDVPEMSRVLVTSHDAFRYFGRAFDLDVVAVQGVSTQQEASTADIGRVAGVVADRDVGAVFVETSVSGQTVNAVLAAVRHRGGDARLGAPLYSDSTGEDGTPEGTYLGMVRANAERIAEGLR